MNVLRIFNGIAIAISSSIITLLAAIFYIGSREQRQELVRNLPYSYLERFLGFFLLALITSGLLFILNYIIEQTKIILVTKGYSLKVGLISFLIGILSALAGTAVFFFH